MAHLLPTCLQAWQQAAQSTPILALHRLRRVRCLIFEAGSLWSRIGGFELLPHLQKPLLSHGILNAEGRREEALLVEEEEVLIDGLSGGPASSIEQRQVIETLHFHLLFFGQTEWPEWQCQSVQNTMA